MSTSGISLSGYRVAWAKGQWEILPPKDDSPIEMILGDIERALKARLYYLAVIMALTLPDVCAALEDDKGVTSGNKYKAWYNANLAHRFWALTDVDAYSLRCGVAHQGRFGHPHLQYDRVLFLLPASIVAVAGTRMKAAEPDVWSYSHSVVPFCQTIIQAVREWYSKMKDDPNVQANIPKLVRLHPDGLAPYVKGIGVIA